MKSAWIERDATETVARYAAQGKTYVNIAFGCTGGRHRSVFMAEKIAANLRQGGFSPTVLHRNLAPPGGAKDKLTVSLWLARDPRVITDLPPIDPTRAIA